LRAALAAAEAGNESKALFLAMMSHELRTPLQSITGYADFVLDPRSDPLTRQQREDVLAISHGARRMQTLVGQLLELSRMDISPLTVHHERVALKPIIDQVLRELAPQMADKGLRALADVPADTPDVVGDTGRIHQILSSLAGNAVKFTHQGSIQITVQPQGDEVAIRVRDSGVGIAEEQLPYIFEPFRQGHDGLTRPYEGAGLGLTVAERLARQMHGRIAVQSEPGAGATFTVWLPAAANRAPDSPGK
jgi:signal transduction histidine kinase